MKKMSVILLILMTVMLVAYQNCGKAMTFSGEVITASVVEEEGTVTPIEDPEDPNLLPNCKAPDLKFKTITMNFPSTPDCKWSDSVAGNLNKVNGYIQARHEEVAPLELPDNSTICDIEFDFPEQTFEYDDHVILTLNNRILMNTGKDMHKYLTSDSGGYIYDWSKLKGKIQNVGVTDLYCNELMTCEIPDTERLGKIHLDIAKSMVQTISTKAMTFDPHFRLITTGDNDTGDCNHTPISFKIKLTYNPN